VEPLFFAAFAFAVVRFADKAPVTKTFHPVVASNRCISESRRQPKAHFQKWLTSTRTTLRTLARKKASCPKGAPNLLDLADFEVIREEQRQLLPHAALIAGLGDLETAIGAVNRLMNGPRPSRIHGLHLKAVAHMQQSGETDGLSWRPLSFQAKCAMSAVGTKQTCRRSGRMSGVEG
jgi:hypothetical protein